MVKHFLKRALCAVGAAICFAGSAMIPASAARDHENAIESCKLYDPDGLFDEVDQQGLSDIIRQTSDNIDMYIAVYILDASGDGMSDSAVETFADDKYDEFFNVQYGEESDGLMLVLNMPTHYIYITTCGMGELYYYNGAADNRIGAMVSNITDKMRNEDYYGAITRFCSDAESYYNKGIPANGYTYNSDTGMYAITQNGQLVFTENLPWWYGVNWGVLVPVAGVIGLATGLIALAVIKSSYKFKKSLNPTSYISNKETYFYQQDDVFLRTHTTKHYRDPDRGSGGGGGGGGGSSHMSSGGFSHGGGGGHW